MTARPQISPPAHRPPVSPTARTSSAHSHASRRHHRLPSPGGVHSNSGGLTSDTLPATADIAASATAGVSTITVAISS